MLLVIGAILPSNTILASTQAKRPVRQSVTVEPVFAAYNISDSLFSSCKQQVKSAFQYLPVEHLAAIKSVVLHNDSGWRRGLANQDTIYLRCGIGEKEIQAVFVHEAGHVVDVGLINGTKNNGLVEQYSYEYFPVYNDDPSVFFYQIGGRDQYDYVSGYARENHFEDFAESYLYYLLHGPEFRRRAKDSSYLSVKYNYLRYRVFDGQEFGNQYLAGENVLTDQIKYANIGVPFDITKLPF